MVQETVRADRGATHSMAPNRASGAVEDANLSVARTGAPENLLQALENLFIHRHERCRNAVENSVQLGILENAGTAATEQKHGLLMMHPVLAELVPI